MVLGTEAQVGKPMRQHEEEDFMNVSQGHDVPAHWLRLDGCPRPANTDLGL